MSESREVAIIVSKLRDIWRDAENEGVPLSHIWECLDKEISSSREASWSAQWGCRLFLALLITVILHVIMLQIFNESRSICAFPAPVLLAEMIHPLVNCSNCLDINEAPRLGDLTRKEFALNHAHNLRPVVVVGGALHWPAMQVFSYDYLRSLYSRLYPEAITDMTSKGQFFSYSSNIHNLKDLFELTGESAATAADRWYVGWSSSDPHINEAITALSSVPHFLSPVNRENRLTWIFMGTPGPGASLHVDSVGEPSWQAQISGTKTWTFVPPVECESSCNSFNVTVHRGDIIVVDTNRWYHQTFIHAGDISITIGSEYVCV